MTSSNDNIAMLHNENCEEVVSTDEELFRRYAKDQEERFSIREYAADKMKNVCACSGKGVKNVIHSVLPITHWLPRYKVKENFLREIASGITVGIVHIPQGMAYSLLASLPPANGLYVSFFPVLIYVLLGTTPHLSIGTFAVVTLMVGAVIDKNVVASSYCSGQSSHNISNTTATLFEQNSAVVAGEVQSLSCDEYENRKVEVAIAISVAVAIIHFIMYVLQLGIIHVFLSNFMVSGFTCGAAFHVFTSQVPKLFGIKVERKSGVLAIVYTYIDFFKNITTINWATVITSFCCILVLVVGKMINEKFKKKLPFPLPWELVVVIFSTLASQFGYLQPNYDVSVVGEIPQGIKTSVPASYDIGLVILDAIPIAIVIFSISISLSTLFSEKHGYDVNLNQELLAYAVANTFGSFFQCFPSSASLSRSLVWEQSGGKTQITGVVSSILILITLLWIGPLFSELPQAALGAIIIVNLKNMLLKFKQLKPLWKVSKLDAVTWFVTWLAVVLLGVDLGLYVGVGFSLFTVILRTQITFGNIMVEVPVGYPGVYRSSKRFDGERDGEILIFKFPSPLIYANQQRFKNQLSVALGFKPAFEISKREKLKEKSQKQKARQDVQTVSQHESGFPSNVNLDDEHASGAASAAASTGDSSKIHEFCYSNDVAESQTSVHVDTPHSSAFLNRYASNGVRMPSFVILDMSICSFIDNSGVNAIKALHESLSKLDIRLLLARCTADVRRCLLSGGFEPETDDSSDNKPVFFVLLEKAVTYAKRHLEIRQRSSSSDNLSHSNESRSNNFL